MFVPTTAETLSAFLIIISLLDFNWSIPNISALVRLGCLLCFILVFSKSISKAHWKVFKVFVVLVSMLI